jgi:hypothetical protein
VVVDRLLAASGEQESRLNHFILRLVVAQGRFKERRQEGKGEIKDYRMN